MNHNSERAHLRRAHIIRVRAREEVRRRWHSSGFPQLYLRDEAGRDGSLEAISKFATMRMGCLHRRPRGPEWDKSGGLAGQRE